MSEKTPIPKQEGLSQEQLDSMQPVEQKYHAVGPSNLTPQLSIKAQREQLKNMFLKNLIEFDKARANASPTDKYANDSCIDEFAEKMIEGLCDVIKGQMWNVTTSVSTDVKTPSWDGVVKGSTVNIITSTCVTNE